MGEVYLARDVRLGRVVALKVVGSDIDELAGAQRQLAHEARATANLTHPNVVTLYDVGQHEGRIYIALEYVRGRTLAEALREGPLPLDDGLRVMKEVAAAIAAAHEVGVTHRDLKPANILLGEDGRTRVLDFGIARITARLAVEDDSLPLGDDERSGLLSVVGTPRYMAPEQWDDEDGPPADVWAFGVVAHAILSGRHLLPRAPGHARLLVSGPEPMALSPEAKQQPPEVVAIVEACLLKDPDARPSARDLVERLDALGGGERAEACPYPGLAPYDRATAAYFAGRDETLRVGLEQLALDGVLVVVGPPSAGKTSFVAATVARLRELHAIEVLSLHAGARPFHGLASALIGWTSALNPSEDLTEAAATVPDARRPSDGLREAAELDETSLAWALEREPERVHDILHGLAGETGRRVVVVVDDLESLVGRGGASEDAAPFLSALLSAAEPGGEVSIVLALRDDALARVPWGEAQARVLGGTLFLRQPDAAALTEMVRAPLARVGYRLEDERAAARMGEALGDRPNALPLLQFAMREAWRRRDPRTHTIPAEATDALSDPSLALARHADRVIDAFDKARLALTRRLLLRLVTEERRLAQVAAQDVAEELGLQALTLVDKLVGEGLLQRDDADRVTLAHEALIDSWPRLRRWLEESDVAYVRLRELELAAQRWVASGETDDELLRGDALRDGERALAALPDRLSDAARRLVTRSIADRSRRARQRRIRRALLGLAAVAVVAASLVSAWALRERAQTEQEARARTERDRVRLLAAGARSQYLRGDHLRARAMARAALESADDVSARALVDEMGDDPVRLSRVLGGVVYEAALDAEERRVYLASQTSQVLQLDVGSGEVEPLVTHADQVTALDLAADGAVVSVDWSGVVRRTLGGDSSVVSETGATARSLVVTGEHLVLGRDRRRPLRLALDGTGTPHGLGPPTTGSAHLTLGPEGRLWTADRAGRLLALDETGGVRHDATIDPGLRGMEVNERGRVAFAASDGVIGIYAPARETVEARWRLAEECRFVRWLADDALLAGCGASLYVLREGEPVPSPRPVDDSLVVSADVGPRLVAVATGAGLSLFDRARLLAPRRDAPPDSLGLTVASSPAHDLAFLGTVGTLHVFALSSGRHLRRVRLGTADVRGLAVTSDALLVAHGRHVTRFALPSLARTHEFSTNADQVFGLQADGDRVLAGGGDGALYVCDLESGLIAAVRPVADGALRGVVPLPGGGWVVASGGALFVVDEADVRPLATLPSEVRSLAWRGASHGASGAILASDVAGDVWAVDPDSGDAARLHRLGSRAYGVDAHGGAVAVVSADGLGRIWRGDGDPVVLSGHRGEVNAVSFVEGGARVLTGSDDATLRLWDARTGALVWRSAHDGTPTREATVDGVRWVGGDDGAVVAEGGGMRLPGTESAPVTLVTPGPGGTLVVGFANGVVGLWDPERLEPLRSARLHGAVTAVRLDGDTLDAFSELGDRLSLRSRALAGGRCRALELLWAESALVWAFGRLEARPPPADHACAP